jgi:ribosome recycling factor
LLSSPLESKGGFARIIINMNIQELKTKLSKSIDFLKTELSQVRTGRASPSLIEAVLVDAYDSKMSIKELGTIIVMDSQNLAVAPWDKSLLKAIAKAIRESDLGLNPVDESDRVRVPVPSLNEERRVELTKMVSGKVEECKSSLRNVRQDVMKNIDKEFTDKEIGEDVKFTQKEEVEKIVKSFVEQADELGETKRKELLAI